MSANVLLMYLTDCSGQTLGDFGEVWIIKVPKLIFFSGRQLVILFVLFSLRRTIGWFLLKLLAFRIIVDSS